MGRAPAGPIDRGPAQQRKALLRNLIKEIQVIGRDEIVPTYRIPLPGSRSVRLGGADRLLFELPEAVGFLAPALVIRTSRGGGEIVQPLPA